jgi:hypothetical protein
MGPCGHKVVFLTVLVVLVGFGDQHVLLSIGGSGPNNQVQGGA